MQFVLSSLLNQIKCRLSVILQAALVKQANRVIRTVTDYQTWTH